MATNSESNGTLSQRQPRLIFRYGCFPPRPKSVRMWVVVPMPQESSPHPDSASRTTELARATSYRANKLQDDSRSSLAKVSKRVSAWFMWACLIALGLGVFLVGLARNMPNYLTQ